MQFQVGDIFNLNPPAVGHDADRQNSDRIITGIYPMINDAGKPDYWMWWRPVGRRSGGVSTYTSAQKHWKLKDR